MPNLGYPRPLSTDKVEPDSEVRLLKCCSSKPVQPLTQSFDFSIQVIQASVIWGFHRGTLILFSFPVFHFYTSFFFQKVDKSLSLNKKKTQGNVSRKCFLLWSSTLLFQLSDNFDRRQFQFYQLKYLKKYSKKLLSFLLCGCHSWPPCGCRPREPCCPGDEGL